MKRKELREAANKILEEAGQNPDYTFLTSRDYKRIREYGEPVGSELLLNHFLNSNPRSHRRIPKYVYNDNWECEEWV